MNTHPLNRSIIAVALVALLPIAAAAVPRRWEGIAPRMVGN